MEIHRIKTGKTYGEKSLAEQLSLQIKLFIRKTKMPLFSHYTPILVTFSWALICLIMGITLLFLNTPDRDTLKTYNVSVRVLAVNYLILTLLLFGVLYFGIQDSDRNIFSFPDLFIQTSQIMNYAFAFITLFVPKYFAVKKVRYHNFIPFGLLFALYLLFSFLFGDPDAASIPVFFSKITHPTIFIRFLFLLFSGYLIIRYGIFINRLRSRYNCSSKHHRGTVHLNVCWVKRNFYFVLSMGVLSLIASCCTNMAVHTILTLVFSVFYFLFAILYMQYKQMCLKTEPLNSIRTKENATGNTVAGQKNKSGWEKTRDLIIQEKMYLQPGITINDMAEKFNTNRTSFSTALNKHEGQNFNAFINQLRIGQAKQLMLENPELTIAEITQKCGFTEQSNFTRQFKQSCNETPAVWRKKQVLSPD